MTDLDFRHSTKCFYDFSLTYTKEHVIENQNLHRKSEIINFYNNRHILVFVKWKCLNSSYLCGSRNASVFLIYLLETCQECPIALHAFFLQRST